MKGRRGKNLLIHGIVLNITEANGQKKKWIVSERKKRILTMIVALIKKTEKNWITNGGRNSWIYFRCFLNNYHDGPD